MKKKKTLLIVFAVLIILIMLLAVAGIIEETLGMIISLALTVVFTVVMSIVAMKHDALLVSVLMILFTVLGSALLFVNLNNFLNGNVDDKKEFYLEVKPTDTGKKKLFTINDKDFYTYHLSSEIFVKMSTGESYSLRDALFYSHVTLDEITGLAIKDENTSGYSLYYDGGSTTSERDRYAIIVCEKNDDVIFGNYNLSYDASICSNDED